MGSHSLVTKQVMYEEAVRVPFLLRVPFRNQRPHRVTEPVSHIDTVPTLLELLGKKDPAGPSHLRRHTGEDYVFIEWTADSNDQEGPDARTVISPDGWKLVLHDSDHCMLFNRKEDPLEMHNLYGRSEHAGMVRKLRAKVEEWQQKTKDKMPMPV